MACLLASVDVAAVGRRVRRARRVAGHGLRRGRVSLRNTAWTARSGNIPLGSYLVDVGPGAARAEVSDSNGVEVNSAGVRNIKGVVSTDDGSLVLSGTITLSGARYSIDLNATGPVARDESFRRAVSVLATPSATGFEVLISGQL